MAQSISVPQSGVQDIDALLQGSRWNSGNITYSFPTSESVYPQTGHTDPFLSTFQAITADLQARITAVLRLISQYANVTFTQVTESSTTHADIRFGRADLSGDGLDAIATSFFPSDVNHDVWLQKDVLDFRNSGFGAYLPQGSFGFMTLLHEIGHTLGLQHPTGALQPSHDGWDYSLMDYRAYPGQSPPFTYGSFFPETPMIADIEALQYLYGANYNTNNTDTVYRWDPQSGQEFVNGVGQGLHASDTLYMTVWDGGGVDTYDLSNFTTNLNVDLRPGAFSTFSTALLADLGTDHIVYAEGNVANALLFNFDSRSLIENATGGSGDDSMTGNDAANVLHGNGGDDTLYYAGGTNSLFQPDTLFGDDRGLHGDTADFSLSPFGVNISPVVSTMSLQIPGGGTTQIVVDDGSLFADALGNSYVATTGSQVGPLTIANLHGIENINGSPYLDHITGNLGDNIINAGGGNDTVFYTGGFDTLNGGSGDNTVDFSNFGSAVDVTLRPPTRFSLPQASTSDSPTIAPNSALRPIANLANFSNAVGTAFNDHLQGNSGDNTLDGGAGDDTLFYNGGVDILNGNTGNDTADFTLFGSAVSVDLTSSGFDAQSNGTTSVLTGNLTGIAALQGIENVNATNFNDVLHGDSNANVINAEAGVDTVDGGFGNDTLIGGGDTNDTVSYQSHDGQTTLGQQSVISLGLNGADGSYTRTGFVTKAGPTTLEADVLRGFQNVIGSTQSETINGNELDNRFVGRGGNDTINGGGGNDTYDLTGPAAASVGNNTFFDQSGTDNVRINFFSNVTSASRVGNDLVVGLTNGSFRVVNHFAGNPIENLTTFDGQSITLSISNIGGNGSGLIAGGNGGDTLDGRGGDDFLFGGNGADRVIGGDGNDQLSGGNGPDTFVFGSGFGHDIITDFSPADHLEFDDGLFGTFQALQSAAHQIGTDTVITLDPNNSITLQNFSINGLVASHVGFG